MFGILGFSAAMGKRQKPAVSRPNSPRKIQKTMPTDLLIDIFSRLPLEDVARCRCVSKLWSSILRDPDFTNLYLKNSSARPRILLTFIHNGRRIFSTVPQELDPDRDYSIPISPYFHMDFPKGFGTCEVINPPILGLVCSNEKKPMIYNPSTGEYLSLPRASVDRKEMSPFFGYDPVDKVFKILCVSEKNYVCRVATVATEEMTWRTVECPIPHQTLHTDICIDGVIYYLGQCMAIDEFPTLYMVVCFDVKHETFKFLPVEFRVGRSALINHKGKLGVVWTHSVCIDEYTKGIELWVLEDGDEVKWSKSSYILPPSWKTLAEKIISLYIVGMTSAGEVVVSTCYIKDPFYMFYYNVVTNTVVRVKLDFGVLVLKARGAEVLTFIDHVANVALMD